MHLWINYARCSRFRNIISHIISIFIRDITLNSAYKSGVHKDVRRGNLRPLSVMFTIRTGLVYLPRQNMHVIAIYVRAGAFDFLI